MKLAQVLKLAFPMALLGWTSCKQEEVKPSKPKGPTVAALQKQLDDAKSDIAQLEEKVTAIQAEKNMAVEKLRQGFNNPEALLKSNLEIANVEASAILGWLKSAKKTASASSDIEDSTNYNNARDHAQECIDRGPEIEKLFGEVQERSKVSGEDMQPITVQHDMLMQSLQEMSELLKSGT